MQNLNIDVQELCKALKDTSAVVTGYLETEKIPPIKILQTDSRKVQKGDWFICLQGEKFDAHEFVEQVLKKNPAGIIFRKDYPFSSQIKSKLYGIAVTDTLVFFSQTARWWRNKVNPFVIALTGTNGKTSAKEILFHLLRSWQDAKQSNQAYKNNTHTKTVQCTFGNLNNQFGVPMTLLSLSPQTKFLVVEIGTNHPGEIAPLSRLAKPDRAAIVSIAEGHIGNFADIKAIALEKVSICEGLSTNGFLRVQNDISQKELLQEYCKQHAISLRYVDENTLTLQSLQENGSWFFYNNKKFFFSYAGIHQFNNLKLMFSLFQEIVEHDFQKKILQISKEKHYFEKSSEISERALPEISKKNITEIFENALDSLQTLNIVDGRLHPLVYKNITLWDDAYNANVTSFEAAITFLSQLALQNKTAKKKNIHLRAAVGHMGELGNLSLESHKKIGELFAQNNFTSVAFFSDNKAYQNAFTEGYTSFAVKDKETIKNLRLFSLTEQDRKQAIEFLLEHNEEDCVYVLVKGSNATGMKHVVSFLQEKLEENL